MTLPRPVARSLAIVSSLLCLSLAACSVTPLEWDDVDRLIEEQFPDVPRISTDELATALAEGRPILLLDARDAEEYAVSHLPGALNVTSEAQAVRVLARADDGALVVAYCSVGYRSAALVDDLRELGIPGVVNLQGSIFRWANERRPVYRGAIEVDEVHPFDDAWGALLDPDLWALEPGPVHR